VTGVLLSRGRVARALFWSVAGVKNAPVESLRVRVPVRYRCEAAGAGRARRDGSIPMDNCRRRIIWLKSSSVASEDSLAARRSISPFTCLSAQRALDQDRDCRAAEIQRFAENAPRWPDVNGR